jgi:hypothetical protein
MLRLPSGRLTGLLALAALCALPALAGAQQRSMRFRPVPPESAAAIEGAERRATSRAARADTAAAEEVLGIPAPQAPPEPPEPPQIRSTSGDMVRFGSDITIGEDQVIEGDVVAFGGDVEIRGRVTGNVSTMGGDLHLGSTAKVEGDVVCIGGTLREEPGSQVAGQRVTAPRTPGAKFLFPMLAVVGTGVQIVVHAVGLLIMLGIAWAFVKLAPERTRGALDTIRQEPGPSFLIGLLLWALIIPSVIALALVMALLCITIIGIPLAAAVAVAYVAFFVLAGLWGSIVGYGVLGGRLYPRFRQGTASLMQAVVWGAIALHGLRIAADLFHIVPLFGFLGGLLKFMYFVIALALGTLGAGALVRGEYRRRSLQNWWSRMRPSGASPGDVPPPPAPPPASGSGAEVIG